MTQAPSVYEDLTVAENLRFFARVLGARAPSRPRSSPRSTWPATATPASAALSGGQRSRVAWRSRSSASPALLVLDEPTVGLDPVLRRDLWELFHRLADDGTAVLSRAT